VNIARILDSRETTRAAADKNRMRISINLMALLLSCVSTSHAAACSKPSFYATEPDAPGSFSKPSVPYCFHDRSCDEWQVRSYVSDVEDYIRKLKQYANGAIDFSNEARSFAEDAISYAKCEADEVNSQHR
jgi:hypothetical protein